MKGGSRQTLFPPLMSQSRLAGFGASGEERLMSGDTTRAEDWIDGLCDRYEAAWKSGHVPMIGEWLVQAGQLSAAERRKLLVELVAVDLPYRWGHAHHCAETRTEAPSTRREAPERSDHLAAGWLLDDYVREFPELGAVEQLPEMLIIQEYRARQRWGDRPNHESFLQRFPGRTGALERRLAEVDAELTRSPIEAAGTETAAPESGRSASSTDAGQVRLGRFRLVERIGEGGCGAVYKAIDEQSGEWVAIKRPRRGAFQSDVERERFLREARTASRLRHPNVCPVYEVGEDRERMFIVLKYIAGKTLHYRPHRRVAPEKAAELAAKIARAVQHAHERGIVHRDIKPSNVMIDAASGEPVLMDFGLAKELIGGGIKLTHTGDIAGTPAYMSPEQARGQIREIGPASDVYSLGAVLYELLTGRPPFEGRAAVVLVKVPTEEPPAIRKLVPGIHPDLETICRKAMSKAPADRYATAAELATDLEQYIAGRQIATPRPSSIGRWLAKLLRRQRRPT